MKRSTSSITFDWNACILCQDIGKREPLQCPAYSKRSDLGAGYQSVASSLMRFAELGELPSYVRLAALDEGQGVEATLTHHSAKWHKSCRDNFNTTKLNRAEKRKQAKAHTVVDSGPVYNAEIPFADGSNEPHFTRSTIAEASGSNACCFFCDQSEGTLRTMRSA